VKETSCISLRYLAASLSTGVTGQKSRDVAIASEILSASFANIGPRCSQSSVLLAIAARSSWVSSGPTSFSINSSTLPAVVGSLFKRLFQISAQRLSAEISSRSSTIAQSVPIPHEPQEIRTRSLSRETTIDPSFEYATSGETERGLSESTLRPTCGMQPQWSQGSNCSYIAAIDEESIGSIPKGALDTQLLQLLTTRYAQTMKRIRLRGAFRKLGGIRMPPIGKKSDWVGAGLAVSALSRLVQDFLKARLHDVGEKARVIDRIYRIALK
jgi:hypothetical protein